MGCCNGPKGCKNFDDEREGISDADLQRFGGDDIACPSCGAEVYHDAAMCHSCGHAMTDASVTPTKKWLVAVAAVLLGLIAFVTFKQVI